MPTKNDSMKKQKHDWAWAHRKRTEIQSHLESSFQKEENQRVREKNITNNNYSKTLIQHIKAKFLNKSFAPLKQRSLSTLLKAECSPIFHVFFLAETPTLNLLLGLVAIGRTTIWAVLKTWYKILKNHPWSRGIPQYMKDSTTPKLLNQPSFANSASRSVLKVEFRFKFQHP